MPRVLTSALFFALSTGIAFADAANDCDDETLAPDLIIAACTQALSEDPTDEDAAQYLINRGIAFFNTGDQTREEADYLAAIERDGARTAPYFNLYLAAFARGDLDAADIWADRSIEAHPDNPFGYEARMHAILNGPQPTACVAIVDQVATLLPPMDEWPEQESYYFDLFSDHGYCLDVNEQDERALPYYEAARTFEPDQSWLLDNIAIVAFYDVQRYALAVEVAGHALEVTEPSSGLARILIGAHMELDQFDQALAAMRSYGSVLSDPDDDRVIRNALAWGLFLRGRAPEASTVIEPWAARALNDVQLGRPTTGHVWDTIAHIRAATGDTHGAVDAFHLMFEHAEDRDAARTFYRAQLTWLGITVGAGDAGILEALNACAAMGSDCNMTPEERRYTAP